MAFGPYQTSADNPKPALMSSPIVTRFAPSPTGYLHIGGARTALFNWLYARGRGGKFLLRIEDTDRARHNEAAVGAIIDGLTWLGLDWDGDPVSQYARRERHAEIANALAKSGAAYRCYMTAEEIEAARNKALETKTRFESPWRDAKETPPAGAPFTIRIRAPREGFTIVDDEVQGRVEFPNSALDDMIILRSDSAPTYNLAVVVDDHDMGVTHVIRGDDHLNNAARQQQIYAAMNWAIPSFSHVPLIHGADGAKLSKRHGALGVDAYRDMGILPEALSNYLIRLGWSHGDDEIISREQALEWFDIAAINKAPARLDPSKLEHLNAHYVKALDDKTYVEKARPFLMAGGVALTAEMESRLTRAAPFLKERTPTLAQSAEAAAFLFAARPIKMAGAAQKALQKDGALALLQSVMTALESADWSSAPALEEALKQVASQSGVGFGQIGQPLRAALTGGMPSPALGEVLYSLGRAEGLARLKDVI